MTIRLNFAYTALCIGLSVGVTGAAQAQSTQPAATNNRCWGEIASGLAQYDSTNYNSDTMNGGSMGMHTRSGTAADINGGFATTGIIQQPRTGAGNVSKGPPHNTAPGDGGMGQHAVNNGEFFTPLLDPVTGTPMGGTGEPIECSLDLQPNIP